MFVARANAICAPLVAQGKTLQAQFPVKNFDPRNPKPADLPAVGAYLAKVNAAFTATASKLLQVPPPNGNPAATAELSGLIAKNLANGQAQIAAAQRRDVKAFVAAGAQGKQLVAQIIAASGKLGFTAQSSCVKVFTG